jgi:hypothetical protein
MSDRIPGSSYDNPIWVGKWRIYVSDNPLGMAQFTYAFVHDDYDGADDANDNRHGYARTVVEATHLIADLEDEASNA